MSEIELFQRLAVALAIGLLIGLERGWQTRDESDRERAAGLRTFALTGVLGGVSALIAEATSPLVLGAALVAYTASLVIFTLLEGVAERNFSVTGVVAGILTFMLGAYAILGDETIAVAAAVVMAILLALRDTLHTWIRTITWAEMRSVLVLLAMSFLLLPILPNRPIDPWQVLNPAEIWFLAILIAAVSFVGYVAVRLLGETRGTTVAAIAGGLASSTATTVSFARLAREKPQSRRLLAAGALLSGATMLVRVVVLVALLRPMLVGLLLTPILAGLTVLLASAFALHRSAAAAGPPSRLEIKNPFDLVTVLWLAGLIGVIMLAAKGLSDNLGQAGILLLAAVAGIADVDALTMSVTRLSESLVVTPAEGALAILVAVGVNTVSKAVMATIVGGRTFGAIILSASFLTLGAMMAAHFLMPQIWP